MRMRGCKDIVRLLADFSNASCRPRFTRDLERHLANAPLLTQLKTYESTVSLLRTVKEDDLPPELRWTLKSFLDRTAATEGFALTAREALPANLARACNRIHDPKRPRESATEMVQVVLPNDANPLGFILGGTVMHLIDIAGAIACHRHTRSLLVTAAVDGLAVPAPDQSRRPDHSRAQVTAAWSTSLEVEVEVFSEDVLTGVRRMTSRAYLTFVAIDRDGHRRPVPGLLLETEQERQRAADAERRRAERLRARTAL